MASEMRAAPVRASSAAGASPAPGGAAGEEFPPSFAAFAAARARFLEGRRAESEEVCAEQAIRAVFDEIE